MGYLASRQSLGLRRLVPGSPAPLGGHARLGRFYTWSAEQRVVRSGRSRKEHQSCNKSDDASHRLKIPHPRKRGALGLIDRSPKTNKSKKTLPILQM
jgi:hypothetical protein